MLIKFIVIMFTLVFRQDDYNSSTSSDDDKQRLTVHSIPSDVSVPFWTENDNVDIFENDPAPVLESSGDLHGEILNR